MAIKWGEKQIKAGTVSENCFLVLKGGGTNGCVALMKALQDLVDNKQTENPSILLLTDGDFTDAQAKWEDLREVVKKSNVKIHTIAIEAG